MRCSLEYKIISLLFLSCQNYYLLSYYRFEFVEEINQKVLK